MDRQKLRKGWA